MTYTPYTQQGVQQFGLPSYGYQPQLGRVGLGWTTPYVQAATGTQPVVATPQVVTAQPTTVQPNSFGLSLAEQQARVANLPTTTEVINGRPTTVIDNTGSVYDVSKALNNTSDSSLFGWGKNSEGQTTFGGASGAQWAGMGFNVLGQVFNAYQAHKASKLARAQFEDMKALNHANYQNQAKQFNNSMRNQMSGRGYIGMTSQAKQTLGKEYNTRKTKEDY